jgi:hypothetical protein
MPTRKPPRPLESAILAQILDYLKIRGVLHWRQNSGAFALAAQGHTKRRFFRAGAPGISDVIGVLPGGRFLAIEVKREGEYPTDAQLAFMTNVNDAGGLAFVARSVEEVAMVLDAAEKGGASA